MLPISLFLLPEKEGTFKKLKREIKDSVILVSLLNDASLEAVNRVAVKFGRRYRRPPIAKRRARVIEHKDFSFFKRLMQSRPEGGGYHQ